MEMMDLLKELAAKGRTVVIVTHAMENLDKCDKVAFLGRGGRLCYFGEAAGAMRLVQQAELFPHFRIPFGRRDERSLRGEIPRGRILQKTLRTVYRRIRQRLHPSARGRAKEGTAQALGNAARKPAVGGRARRPARDRRGGRGCRKRKRARKARRPDRRGG